MKTKKITQILPLTDAQLKVLPQDLDKTARPFRIMCCGKSVNICTGILHGGNVIYHIFYWDRPKEFRNLALQGLRENNPGETFRYQY